MVIDKIRKMSIKGVKLKSESFFSISPGVLELWRKNLRGADSAPPPVQIGLSCVVWYSHVWDLFCVVANSSVLSCPVAFGKTVMVVYYQVTCYLVPLVFVVRLLVL